MMDYVDYIEDEEVMDRECDFLVLASTSDVINSENVENIHCKVVVEASN